MNTHTNLVVYLAGEKERWIVGCRQPWGVWKTGVVHCCLVSYWRCVKGLTDFHKWLMGISVRTLELRVFQLYVVVRWGRDSPPLCKPSHRFPHVWTGLLQSRSPGGKEGGACPRSASPFSLAGHNSHMFRNNQWAKSFKRQEFRLSLLLWTISSVAGQSDSIPWWVHSSESDIYSVLPLSSLSLPLSVYLFPKTQEVLNPLRLVDMVCLPQGICLIIIQLIPLCGKMLFGSLLYILAT